MTDADDQPFVHLTPERIAKGGLDYSLYPNGTIRSAQAVQQSILSHLIRLEKIEDYAVSSLATYEDWKSAHNFEVDPQRYTKDGLSVSLPFTKADCYRHLLRGLSFVTLSLIERARWDEPKPHLVESAIRHPQPYREAFDRLSEGIARAQKESSRHNRT